MSLLQSTSREVQAVGLDIVRNEKVLQLFVKVRLCSMGKHNKVQMTHQILVSTISDG